MINKLSFGGMNPTPRDTNLMYGDPVEQLKKDIKEIAAKVNEIVDALNKLEESSQTEKSQN